MSPLDVSPVITKVCFEIGCRQDIKDKHFMLADLAMMCLWKVLVIT